MLPKSEPRFNVPESSTWADASASVPAENETSCNVQTISDQEMILLSTKTCPNCRIASSELKKAGISFRVLYAEDPEGENLARRLGISNAPTLVVSEAENVRLIGNVSNIREFISGCTSALK